MEYSQSVFWRYWFNHLWKVHNVCVTRDNRKEKDSPIGEGLQVGCIFVPCSLLGYAVSVTHDKHTWVMRLFFLLDVVAVLTCCFHSKLHYQCFQPLALLLVLSIFIPSGAFSVGNGVGIVDCISWPHCPHNSFLNNHSQPNVLIKINQNAVILRVVPFQGPCPPPPSPPPRCSCSSFCFHCLLVKRLMP